MPLDRLPHVAVCCHCIVDLKTASAIIAVLAIVTSPMLSWALIRHSYVIRVSCFISTSSQQADVVDINLNNVLTFGFGANAGLSPSCLKNLNSTANNNSTTALHAESLTNNEVVIKHGVLVSVVKYLGWFILVADGILIFASAMLLSTLFMMGNLSHLLRSLNIFLFSAIVSMIFSFIYGMLYVATCLIVGGSFPIFEFCFNIFDLGLWIYFIIIVNSFRLETKADMSRQITTHQQV